MQSWFHGKSPPGPRDPGRHECVGTRWAGKPGAPPIPRAGHYCSRPLGAGGHCICWNATGCAGLCPLGAYGCWGEYNPIGTGVGTTTVRDVSWRRQPAAMRAAAANDRFSTLNPRRARRSRMLHCPYQRGPGAPRPTPFGGGWSGSQGGRAGGAGGAGGGAVSQLASRYDGVEAVPEAVAASRACCGCVSAPRACCRGALASYETWAAGSREPPGPRKP